MLATDGCGAPLYGVSPYGLCVAFQQMVRSPAGSYERQVADAIRTYPAWASGDGELDTSLMAALPGLLVKSGAEGVLAFAHESGAAGAVKVQDGSSRPLGPVAVAVLAALGLGNTALQGMRATPVSGGSQVVGHVEAAI